MFGNCYAPHVENNYEFALRKCVVKFLNYLKVVTTRTNPLMLQAHKTKKRMPPIFNEDLAYEWLFDDLDWNRIFNSQIYLNPFIPRTDQISFSVLFFYAVYCW